MPRGKHADLTGGAAQSREKRQQQIARFWTDRIRSGIKAREDYDQTASETEAFFKARHTDMFDSPSLRAFLEFDGDAGVSVPKAAQVRNSLGPRLYQKNPTRTVTPTTQDPIMLGLCRVLEAYVNYTPREARLAKEIRRSVDDAMIRGRGFLETGVDPDREIVTSWYVSSKRVVIDPDVDRLEDAEWIAIKHREPLWRVKARTPKKEQWRLKGLKGLTVTQSADSDGATDVLDDEVDEEPRHETSPTNLLVDVWTVYSKMGKGWRSADLEREGGRMDDSKDFVRLEIVQGHSCPIAVGPWEAPLYLDKDWPIAALDLIETLDDLWPVSPMGQVMPLQKTMNLLASILLNSSKQRGRFLLAGDKKLRQDVMARVKGGTMSEFLPIEIKQGERLQDKLKAMELGQLSPEVMGFLDWVERQFEATTGVTPVLHGSSEPEGKDRSATASQLRSDASTSRVGALRNLVEEFSIDAARHEAMVVRLTQTEEEVARYVKPEDIELYMISLEVAGGAKVPVRDTRTDEEREQARGREEEDPITLELIDGRLATYFQSPEEAAEALSMFLEEVLPTITDGRLLELMDQLVGDPASWITPVTVEDVWRDTAGITAKELARETSYSIAVGSMQTLDKEREQAIAETKVQQIAPVALETGNYDVFNKVMEDADNANEVPPDMRTPPLQPPPPPPEAMGAPA